MKPIKTYKGPLPALDLSLTHFERVKNGIRVIGTWWLGSSSLNYPKPCLVLLHAKRVVAPGNVTPIVILERDLWRWLETTPDPVPGEELEGGPTWASRKIAQWIAAGDLPGNQHSMKDRLAVIDAIHDAARDVYTIPPIPPMKSKISVGEGHVVNETTGKVLDSREITV